MVMVRGMSYHRVKSITWRMYDDDDDDDDDRGMMMMVRWCVLPQDEINHLEGG